MTSPRMLLISAGLLCAVLLSACDSTSAPVERVTIAPTVAGAGAPIYTATASLTPSNTPTVTPTATDTPTPTATLTPTATNTPTDTPTPTATHTPPPSSTPDLMTPSPAPRSDVPAVQINNADMSPAEGWSCGDFPCADDLDGWLERIQVPRGFSVSPVGQFPGQVMQIAYGADERLYATVLEDGTRSGAVYALNADGTFERFSETLLMPLGLAFQPGTDVLYVTSRRYDDEYNVERGALWRILSDSTQQLVRDDLPCCYLEIGNQPNGLIFGADGWLYVGVGALTDRGESPNPRGQAYADIQPREAAILRLNPHTGDVEPYAQGLRNTWDIALDSRGNLYATDTGLVTGEGDRLITVTEDGFYGWPYYRNRGCADCPPSRGAGQPLPDLVTFPNYSLPRGLVSYNGAQFPQNMQDTLFVTLWNGTPYAQRVVWIDPRDNRLNTDEYTPQAFVTGLIRPTDVTVAPDGSLVVADFIYGHVWRISYEPSVALPTVGETPEFSATQIGPFQPIGTPPAPFATNTPAN